ncbi:hypothetical protein BJF78_11935 [Pseudonocardia sp. CNS-139]|nr:hypothetical protein BJF78_11935 [Pseudonocardia sp. CNS-139]
MDADSRHTFGRGVLEGGFHLLDVLSRFDGGAGLSELARQAQLPKATTHRLLDQLLALGAVERRGQRYAVGPLLRRLGSSWQPEPALAAAAREPIKALAALTTTVVGVSVLHRRQTLVVSGTRGVLTDFPLPSPGDVLADSTAAARLLQLEANPPDREPPAGYSPVAWRAAHREYARSGSMLVEHEEVVPSVSCAASPVHDADGRVVGVVSALALRRSLPAGVVELTVRAAREVSRNLGRDRLPA